MSEKKLKILVVLPMYGGSLPIGQYCAQALKDMGHLVEVFDAPEFYSAFTALKKLRVRSTDLEYLENSFLQVVSNAVRLKVENFEPHLVLALAQAPLTRQTLTHLRRDGVATAMWFVEDYRIFGYWRAFAPYYDFFAVIQKEPFFSELKKTGVHHFLYLPLAASPDFHRPLNLSPVEKKMYGSDVSFLGAGYPNRRKAFKYLLHYDFKIWGTEWDGDVALAPLLQKNGQRISPEEAVKIFNASKINLNLHSSIKDDQLVSQGDFVNPRTFELAACAAFQLLDERGLLGELFAQDELVTFKDLDQLQEQINYFLAHEEERFAFAAKARERVLKEHTYVHRMQALLDYIDEQLDFEGLKQEHEPWLIDLPEDLREELEKLLNKLGLAKNVGFKDIVHYIRQEQGKLTPLETAILFLDEWQKQYGLRGKD
jgi:spore maturation protein CgeB